MMKESSSQPSLPPCAAYWPGAAEEGPASSSACLDCSAGYSGAVLLLMC
jgi:hypothetical protein